MSIYKHLGRNYDGFESTLESTMEVEEIAAEIEDFEEFHEEMVKESALDMAKVRGGMYVTEQLIENAMFTAENHEVEALIEGAVSDFFTKIKENLTKLWNKIKAWFKHILETIKRFFMAGKDLVKKYKSQITAAAQKHSDLEVKCYKWNPSALSTKASQMIDKVSEVAKSEASNVMADILDGKEDVDMTAAKKKILTDGVGGDKVSEISKTLKSYSRPADKEKYTIGELDIPAFMYTVEKASDIISCVEKANKAIDVAMRKGIEDVDNLAKKCTADDTSSAGKYKKAASSYSELVRYGATLRTTVVKNFTSEVKTMSKQMTAVLKSLLTKAGRPQKDGVKEGAFADVYELLGY